MGVRTGWKTGERKPRGSRTIRRRAPTRTNMSRLFLGARSALGHGSQSGGFHCQRKTAENCFWFFTDKAPLQRPRVGVSHTRVSVGPAGEQGDSPIGSEALSPLPGPPLCLSTGLVDTRRDCLR